MDASPQPPRCLIVDDNTMFTDTASRVLSQQGMAVIAAANSSAEAMARVRELRPDIVLIDVNLGQDNGFDLVDQLHRGGWDTAATVILISARAEQDFTDLIARSPAVGFVTKADLSANAIHRLCSNSSGPDPSDRRPGEQ